MFYGRAIFEGSHSECTDLYKNTTDAGSDAKLSDAVLVSMFHSSGDLLAYVFGLKPNSSSSLQVNK